MINMKDHSMSCCHLGRRVDEFRHCILWTDIEVVFLIVGLIVW